MQLNDLLSIQLYSLRLMGDLDGMLNAVQAAGITQVETFGPQFDKPGETRAALDARGLRATTGHIGIIALRDRFAEIVAASKQLGIAQLYMPAPPPGEREKDAAGWTALGAELGSLSNKLANEGIALGYHNHHWEMDAKDGDRIGLDCLFAGAAGSKLSWEVDVAWVVRGNTAPKPLMTKYRHLITALHVKDIAPEGQCLDEDGWADVGHGVLDWKDLWAFGLGLGARWMVLEHDKPNDAGRFARRSADYLRATVA